MTAEQFDLIVLSAGTRGVGVARPCAKAGWKVAIFVHPSYASDIGSMV